MECFHIDESGYTGFDLLNAEQRFQGAAAVSIGDEEAARLIREHFPKLQAPELKYHALARRPDAADSFTDSDGSAHANDSRHGEHARVPRAPPRHGPRRPVLGDRYRPDADAAPA